MKSNEKEMTQLTDAEIACCEQALSAGGEHNKYYVYMLCRCTGEPFYVGKGQGRRMWEHETEASDVFLQIDADTELSDEEKKAKRQEIYEKLKIINEEGEGLKRVIVKWGLNEREAYMCESALINALRLLSRNDIVGRLTNRVNGHASKAEKENPSDKKTIARIDVDFLSQCAIKQRAIEELGNVRVIFININALYEECLDEDGVPNRDAVRDTVRAFWKREKRHEQAQYIFALYRQRVVGVFHIVEIKTIAQGRAGDFSDYPIYPERARRMDVLKSKAETLDAAQKVMTDSEYEMLLTDLRTWKPNIDPSKTYTNFQKRIYFNVDDNVPENIKAYENCIPTKDGTTDFIRKGRAQFGVHVFNF